ncbi:hypothetical protein BH24ACT15_BH24ACT15_37810 [soil metagenome]
MKRNQLLIAQKVGGRAGYRLSGAAQDILSDGDKRIYRQFDPGAEEWVVALFSVPESERNRRYQIKSRLERLGFGQGPTGSWFAPAAVLPETERSLRRGQLSHYVTLWVGTHVGFGDLADLVVQTWDCDAIHDAYAGYIADADRIAERWRGASGSDRAAAWVDYLDNLARWRPLPYMDPGLPPRVMPDGWRADEARDRFAVIDAMLHPKAMDLYSDVVNAARAVPGWGHGVEGTRV